jgi:hypothetical protein
MLKIAVTTPKPFVFSSAIQIREDSNIQDYKLPLVLYGCEILSLTLREEHRLRVFENSAEEDIWTKEG